MAESSLLRTVAAHLRRIKIMKLDPNNESHWMTHAEYQAREMEITTDKNKTTTIKLTHHAKTIFGIGMAAFVWGVFTGWLLCGVPV